MRTTLDIDDDILHAAKALAAARRETAGQVISQLAREALRSVSPPGQGTRNGFELFSSGGAVVTPELIDGLLEEDG